MSAATTPAVGHPSSPEEGNSVTTVSINPINYHLTPTKCRPCSPDKTVG